MLVFCVYFVIFVLYISFVTIFVCRVTLYFNSTMAEANGICELPKQGVQSILEGFSIDDSERSLPQVPNETLGLSSVSQTLSSSFNRLRRGITNRIGNTLVNHNIKHQLKLTRNNCHPLVCAHI